MLVVWVVGGLPTRSALGAADLPHRHWWVLSGHASTAAAAVGLPGTDFTNAFSLARAGTKSNGHGLRAADAETSRHEQCLPRPRRPDAWAGPGASRRPGAARSRRGRGATPAQTATLPGLPPGHGVIALVEVDGMPRRPHPPRGHTPAHPTSTSRRPAARRGHAVLPSEQQVWKI